MGHQPLASRLGRLVAIKVIAADAAGDRDRRDRFFKEARSASALNHPNIVTIHEVDHANGIDFLVMELVSGRSLNEMVHGGGLTLVRVLDIAEQIANSLATAHAAGIVHRDVKPANIMISDSGQAKMLDFGLAKVLAPSEFQKMSGDDNIQLAYELGRQALIDLPQADGLYIGGGAWLSQPVAEALEREFGKPVITNVAAMIFNVLTQLNCWAPIEGHGRLLGSA